ncbi:MAG TPA: FG-GAP-like repeat-containing protein [bacterium]|nr:FG-GAP-like repeat-containing protein [bacterium]
MKRWLLLWVSTVFVSVTAQQFTKITTGPAVSDGGASRSVNWFDYNNDGYLDLFVSNSSGAKGTSDFLYRNLGVSGNYGFSKIIRGPVVTDFGQSDGASFGDYDNDGDEDVFVVNWYNENNMFYENGGAPYFRYSAVTTGAPVTDGGLSETCVWGDYNNDGYLDLYVTNSGNAGLAQANFLYKNNGNKTFTKITTGSPVTDVAFTRGANWIDYDRDGDQDLFVVNESGQDNALYKNTLIENGTEGFLKVTGVSIASDGGSSMSASWGDLNNDGNLDVLVVNGIGEHEFLYLQNNDHTFTKVTTGDLVNSGGSSMGSALGDFDNDGDLDVYITNSYAGTPSVDFLFKNMFIENGSLSFQKITTGSIVTDQGDGYGCAWGDYDRDGDLDLFVAKTAGEDQNNALYRNDNTTGYHSVQFRCVGTMSNRSAIGTIIRVKAVIGGQGRWQTRVVEGQSGYCGQSQIAHFGLHNATTIDSVEITWPRGDVDIYTGLSSDSIYVLTENTGYGTLGFSYNTEPIQSQTLRDTTVLEDFGRISFISLTDYFYDPDYTDLKFSVSAITSGITVSLTGDSVIFNSVKDFFGSVKIAIRATDDVVTLYDTLTITIEDVAEPILRPAVTVSVFQNPVLSSYADIIVVSTLDLDTAPSLQIQIPGGSGDVSLSLQAISESARIFKTSYKLQTNGTYTLSAGIRTYQLFDTTISRSFTASLAKVGQTQIAFSPDERSHLTVPAGQSYGLDWILATIEETADEIVYNYQAKSLPPYTRFEYVADMSQMPAGMRPVISRWDGVQWVVRPSIYNERTHIVSTEISEAGQFKILFVNDDTPSAIIPEDLQLEQNYPNPFNPSTHIRFAVPQASNVRLTVFNLLGQKVRTLIEDYRSSGSYGVVWDGRNDAGLGVASGIYVYRLEAAGRIVSRKMMLMK